MIDIDNIYNDLPSIVNGYRGIINFMALKAPNVENDTFALLNAL